MNEAQLSLRQHVTRVGFDLSLGKTHVAALVYLEELRLNKWESTNFRRPATGPMARAFGNFVTGGNGLIERGLVTHTLPKRIRSTTQRDQDGVLHIIHDPRIWKITKAGRLVIGLLKESGLYDEYADLIRPVKEKEVGNGDSQGREAS